jgi:hypothetical protein
VNPSYPHDPDLHEDGTPGIEGRCSYHEDCRGEAVVSFEDGEGRMQSGCQQALEELVEREEIEPLGQGA